MDLRTSCLPPRLPRHFRRLRPPRLRRCLSHCPYPFRWGIEPRKRGLGTVSCTWQLHVVVQEYQIPAGVYDGHCLSPIHRGVLPQDRAEVRATDLRVVVPTRRVVRALSF